MVVSCHSLVSVCKHGIQQRRQDFDKAVGQWTVWACVKTKGRHF